MQVFENHKTIILCRYAGGILPLKAEVVPNSAVKNSTVLAALKDTANLL